ncbi:transcription factor Ouib isoform X2 [Drosophila tropicalis]|uniref:transcription factor Ouib isoform X2 n=1 Tax=Drosophila tropicalis TaxID=46794 RepID=UPI0035AB816D
MLINQCRACGKSNICAKSLNLFDTANRKYVKHIYLLTGLALGVLANAPTYMCHCCQSDLKLCMTFRKRCIKTQSKWESLSQSGQDVDVESHSSMSEKEAKVEEIVPQETIQVIVKEEFNIRDELINEEEDQLGLDKGEVLAKNLGRSKNKMTQDTIKDTLTHYDDDNKSDHLEFNSCSGKLDDHNNDKDLPLDFPKKSRKSKDEVKLFICELCGLHMQTKASLGRHILKHTGKRPFGCKECSARFLTAAELRSHHQVHTGERAFPCRFCERKYVSYMGRLRHERNHTNERNFVCDECGKAFTTGYILKNHMLIHSGERAYSAPFSGKLIYAPISGVIHTNRI